MQIAKSYNKKTGVTYVYEILENHWDPEKKRGVPKRRLIGHLDENGNIVPNGKRGRPKKEEPLNSPSQSPISESDQLDYYSLYQSAQSQIREKDLEISRLKNQLQNQEKRYRSFISRLSGQCDKELDSLNQN